MNENQGLQQLESVFPEALLKRACVKKACGGEFNFNKMNFFEKMIIKMVSRAQEKPGEDKDIKTNKATLNMESIEEIAQAISK